MGYDAFISYSHAADEATASVLQDALQRFAKPWYRRRALSVFLDQRGLTVNPGLWSSITEVLDDAGWFVLLASPEAAASEWVNREIDYWLEHRDRVRLLPVVTDGTWAWDRNAGGFDWSSSTAVPPALRDAFAEEPRHIDMSWARDEPSLSKGMPRLLDQVAEIAAPIHGVAKDEIQGQDLREHRRTIRTARLAGVILAVLTFASLVGAFLAVDNAREAERARDESDFERVVAQARVLRSSNRELAALLAVEARHQRDNPLSQGAIQSVLLADPRALGTRVDPAGGRGYLRVCLVDHGNVALTSAQDGVAAFNDLSGHAPPVRVKLGDSYLACTVNHQGDAYVFSLSGTVWPVDIAERSVRQSFEFSRNLNDLAVSPDGKWLATGTADGAVFVWPADRSAEPVMLPSGSGAVGLAFSGDGTVLAATADDEIVFRDVGTWAERQRIEDPVVSQSGGLVPLQEPARHLLYGGAGTLVESRRAVVRAFDLPSGAILWQQTNGFGNAVAIAVAPGGERAAFDAPSGVDERDIRTGQPSQPDILTGEALGESFDYTPDGDTLVTAAYGRVALGVWALDGRSLISRLIRTPFAYQPAYSPSGNTLLSLDQNLSVVAASEVYDVATGQKLASAPRAAFPLLIDDHGVGGFFVDELAVDRFDIASGQRTGPRRTIDDVAEVATAAANSAGRILIGYNNGDIAVYETDGSHRLLMHLDSPAVGLTISARGDLATVTTADGLTLFRVDTGAVVIPELRDFVSGQFSGDGGMIATVAPDSHVVFFDTATGNQIGTPVPSGAGVPGVVMGGTRFLLQRVSDGQLFDLASGQPLGEPFPSTGHPTLRPDGLELAAGDPRGIALWDLDPDHWERAACVLAGRNLTRDEWKTYFPNAGSYHPTCPQWPTGA